MKKYLNCLWCLFPVLLWGQTVEKTQAVQLDLGWYNFNMLDRQASPVIYTLNAPMARVGYQHKNAKRLLEATAYFSLGQMAAKDKNLPKFIDNEVTTYAFGLELQYWKILKKSGQWTHHLGGNIAYDFAIDFESVAAFPWGMGQGRIGIGYQGAYQLKNGHQVRLKASLPLVGIVTRLPYSNIPRVIGKAAGVASFFQVGTSLDTWNTYQQAALDISYILPLSDKWTLSPSYHFSYFAHNQPDKIRAYRQALMLGLRYNF